MSVLILVISLGGNHVEFFFPVFLPVASTAHLFVISLPLGSLMLESKIFPCLFHARRKKFPLNSRGSVNMPSSFYMFVCCLIDLYVHIISRWFNTVESRLVV